LANDTLEGPGELLMENPIDWLKLRQAREEADTRSKSSAASLGSRDWSRKAATKGLTATILSGGIDDDQRRLMSPLAGRTVESRASCLQESPVRPAVASGMARARLLGRRRESASRDTKSVPGDR
jgi:hypothetical protein